MRSACVTWACTAVLTTAAPALAQPKDARTNKPSYQGPFIELTRAAWYNINDLVLASARKMPDEHYSFRPTKDVRTFAEILTHIAWNHYTMCGATVGRKPPAADSGRLKTKDEVSKFLQNSSAVCDLAYGLLNDENAGFRYPALNSEYTRAALLMSNVTHDSEHYGNLVTYMRLKGVVPPSSAGVR